jgi:hypothetical protein
MCSLNRPSIARIANSPVAEAKASESRPNQDSSTAIAAIGCYNIFADNGKVRLIKRWVREIDSAA